MRQAFARSVLPLTTNSDSATSRRALEDCLRFSRAPLCGTSVFARGRRARLSEGHGCPLALRYLFTYLFIPAVVARYLFTYLFVLALTICHPFIYLFIQARNRIRTAMRACIRKPLRNLARKA